MIALCSEHHNFADGGNYSREQLSKMKADVPLAPPKGRLPWNATKVFVMFGGNYFVCHAAKLFACRIGGQEVFSLRRIEDDLLAIDAVIYDKAGDLICKIEQNDILPNLPTLGDLTCTAQGKVIEALSHSNDIRLALRFDRVEAKELIKRIAAKWPKTMSVPLKIDKTMNVRRFIDSAIDGDGLCPTIKVAMDMYSPHLSVRTLGKGLAIKFSGPWNEDVLMTGLDAGEGALRINLDTLPDAFFFGGV
jgi:hypothetical protein